MVGVLVYGVVEHGVLQLPLVLDNNCVFGVMMLILFWLDLILLIIGNIILLQPDLLEFLGLIACNPQVIIVQTF